MSTDLREALHALADDTVVAPGPPPDLWRRGVRRRRTARAVSTASVVAAVTVAVMASTVLWRVPAEVPPATDDPAAALPSRLVTPSRWLSGTGRPPGRLAVVAGAERAAGWWGGARDGLVGVSATTGAYRALDLPDAWQSSESGSLFVPDPVLSPDGRRVAYFLADEQHDAVGGYAVWDAVTGSVARHEVASPLGLTAHFLGWADEDRLVVQYGVIEGRTDDSLGSRAARPQVWRVGRGEPVSFATPTFAPSAVAGRAAGGLVAFDGGRIRSFGADGSALTPAARVRGIGSTVGSPLVSPEGAVAVVGDTGPNVNAERLLVARPSAGGALRAAVVDTDVRVVSLLAWLGPDRLAVRGAAANGVGPPAVAYELDLATGRSRVLVREDRVSYGAFPSYAADLFSTPVADRPAPESPPDPRLVLVGLPAAAVGLVWFALRRRRHGA